MQKFDETYFDAGIERRGTECVKWDVMAEETGDPEMIPMWVADMDFPSAPAI
jgi:cystathionine beta-lyase